MPHKWGLVPDMLLSALLRCPPCTFLPPPCPVAVLWAGTVTQVAVQLTVRGTAGTILASRLGWHRDLLVSLWEFKHTKKKKKKSPVRNNEGLVTHRMRWISLQMVVFRKRNWYCQIWGFQSLKMKDWFWESFPQSLPYPLVFSLFRKLSEGKWPFCFLPLVPTYLSWLDFCTMFHSGIHRMIFHCNCLFHWGLFNFTCFTQ